MFLSCKKINMFITFALFVQITVYLILIRLNFNVLTNELLTVFVPLVWTAIGTSGLSIIYLYRAKKEQTSKGQGADAETTKRVIHLSFYVLISTVFFVALSFLYPARTFLKQFLTSFDLDYLKSVYDSLLVVSFAVPCFLSVLVGGWILIMELEKDK